MARRALHDEGSNLVTERLKHKVDLDFDTARRLFTFDHGLALEGLEHDPEKWIPVGGGGGGGGGGGPQLKDHRSLKM